mmetsp:Transcript_44243/g.123047  ORF Transcript_44243/g.123047 Transcript_44243/m.123047 type:complete len:216 (+) Transcript_44243:884-1531(+)
MLGAAAGVGRAFSAGAGRSSSSACSSVSSSVAASCSVGCLSCSFSAGFGSVWTWTCHRWPWLPLSHASMETLVPVPLAVRQTFSLAWCRISPVSSSNFQCWLLSMASPAFMSHFQTCTSLPPMSRHWPLGASRWLSVYFHISFGLAASHSVRPIMTWPQSRHLPLLLLTILWVPPMEASAKAVASTVLLNKPPWNCFAAPASRQHATRAAATAAA